MSKRFGRNQKRALREQLRKQAEQAKYLAISANCLRSELEVARNTIQRTSNILGEYFVGLPVKTEEVKDILHHYRFDTKRPAHIYNYDDIGMNSPLKMLEFTLDYLDTYQASVHTDELRRLVHMRYRSINGQVAYGFTDAAWTMLSEHILVPLKTKFIAEEMAKLLVKERKAKGNSRYKEILL